MFRVVVGSMLLALAHQAVAGFSLEGSPSLSSERSTMGRFTPYEQDARANFQTSEADLKPRQARYQDAELLVDLAYKPVTQKGSGHADRVDGFADDVPFSTAMSMILPTGWQLYKDKSLERKDVPDLVSFIGGRSWTDVLGKIGERYALKFHVDWYDRTVVMAKGRQSALSSASRIRVIAEPAPAPKPVVKPASTVATAIPAAKTSAVASAAPAAPAITSNSAKATGPALPKPVLKSEAKSISKGPDQLAVANKPKTVTAPVQPAKPVGFSMKVQAGTLHENVVRLSKEQGWSAPEWKIKGDYRIPSEYTINASGFPEAMVKLLMIHPIEADVNTAQRKIFVIMEVR